MSFTSNCLTLALLASGVVSIPACAPAARAQEAPVANEEAPYPVLVTQATRDDAKAQLEKPGNVLFSDGFESSESLAKYFEVRGSKEGRAKVTSDAKLAHTGAGALQLTAPANDGKSSGAGVSGWFGPEGYERVYLRYYLKFAADYDQGDLNHTGGCLVAAAGDNKWAGMGTAGILPKGDDHFSTSFESWRDWGRIASPGSMHLYTYWMDMKRDRDGNYWGNSLMPETAERTTPQRDRWYCFEIMIKANEVGKSDGELAAWIDGVLYVHFAKFRWRSDAAVKLKRLGLDVCVHHAAKDNTVWYDDVVLSTGYVGPTH